jgi:hypothetical protein
MKRLALFILLACLARAEDFTAVKETSLSSATEVITLQAPASGASASVRLVSGWIDCSVTCTITIERNGTAATMTALTPHPVNNTGSTAKTLVFSGADTGVGTVLAKFTLLNGGGIPLGLNGMSITGNGTTKNITIRTSSITGTVHINLRWTELP